MLNMPDADGERRMAIEIVRFLARRNEMWSWPALPETEPQFTSLFQPIRLEGVAAKQEVSLFPYVAGGRDIVREAGSGKAGLDVFWRPSSAFFVSGAVNPDFGQVEADDVVVNLSAFETFFPEKRLFFLQSWGFNDHTGVDLHFSYDAPHWDDRASRGHGVFKLPPSWWVNARWHSPRDRKVDTSVGIGWRREAMGGSNGWASLSLGWRPVGRIRASTGLIYENWDTWLLWQGNASFATFATERWNLNAQLNAFFTARQHLEMRIQWVALKAFESSRYVVPGGTYLREIERPAVAARADFAISDLVVQLRYRWQIAPLSDLFVVYNRTGGLPNGGPSRPLRRSTGRQLRNAARRGRPRQAALSVRAVGTALLRRTRTSLRRRPPATTRFRAP